MIIFIRPTLPFLKGNMEEPVKKVGRPPNKVITSSIILRGVSDKPKNESSVAETIYSNSSSVKLIFDTLYACNKRDTLFCFNKDNITIYFQDHHDNLSLCVVLAASACVHYYCQEPIEMLVSSEDLKKSCVIVKKDSGFLKFVVNGPAHDRKLYISLHEAAVRSTDKKPLHTSINMDSSKSVKIKELLSREYEFSFKLPSTHFKKRLSTYNQQEYDLCELSYNTASEKNFIRFHYTNSQQKINGPTTSYAKDKDILNYSLGEVAKATMSCSFRLMYMLNVFKVTVSSEFYILMSSTHGLCLNFYLDPVDPSKLAQPFLFKDKVSPDCNGIVLRVFLARRV